MIPDTKLRILRHVVRIFEQGHELEGYDRVTTLRDGPGGVLQVTFGDHQATDKADSLDAIIRLYIARGGALAEHFKPFISLLSQNTAKSCSTLATSTRFLSLLRESGREELMKRCQDEVFDRKYMQPALLAGAGSGFVHPLSYLVLYDSHIHGAYGAMRDRVKTPASDEKGWIGEYLQDREDWFRAKGGLLGRCTYRMDALQDQVADGNWALELPFVLEFTRTNGRRERFDITESDFA